MTAIGIVALAITTFVIGLIGGHLLTTKPDNGREIKSKQPAPDKNQVCDHKQYPYTTEMKGYMHDRICDNCGTRW